MFSESDRALKVLMTLDILEPGISVQSDIPGRIRLRAPHAIADAASARHVEDWMRANLSVRSVTANAANGSLLVEYVPSQLDATRIVRALEDAVLGRHGAGAPKADRRQYSSATNVRSEGSRTSRTRGHTEARRGTRWLSEVVHAAVPGRIRFRSELIRLSPTLTLAVEYRLRNIRGVTHVTTNPHNGSVLVEFDAGATNTAALHEALESVLARERPAPSGVLPLAPNGHRPARRQENGHTQPATATAIPARDDDSPAWFTETVDQVAVQLRTNPQNGLTPKDAAKRLGQYGRNEVPDIPRRPRSAILGEQVVSVPGLMLSAAAIFSLLTGAAIDAVFIGGAIVANAAIGFFTEDYAERTIQSLRQARTPHARILREGRRTKIDLAEVVPGDILLLEPGHVVAADGRVVRADNLLMDESLLTGEQAGQEKTPQALRRTDVPIAERSNMVYAGSAVESGKGAAIVTATGLRTELGRIRTLIGEAPDTPPPMSRELQKLGGTLAVLSAAACTVFAAVGLLMGLPPLEILAVSASLAVSAIPEGLPTVATTTLALGMKRMRAQNVVMRRLQAVAALGSGTVLCVDKTGTLTENRMSVRSFTLEGEDTEVAGTIAPDGIRFIRRGHTVAPQEDPVLMSALQVCALCTEAELQPKPSGELDATGSSTEQALLLTVAAAGVDVPRLRAAHERVAIQGRGPERNYMASLHRTPDGREEVLVKGAPEEVMELCSRELTASDPVPLSPKRRGQLLVANSRLAARGMRLLGLARRVLEPGETWHGADRILSWIGLVAMEDPVRGGAREAVEELRAAGIRTLMLTGDQLITAGTVAQQVGLGEHGQVRVAYASAIEESLASGQPLPDALARVSPSHKYEIVRMLQERGHVVLMTGDGVNDAPALKAADVGIAMGVRSTQIARDIAGVILLDDNLASVPIAVGLGRTIYANIRKALRFLLSSNLADIGLVGASLMLGLSFPLTAVQLLWINLVTDVFPAIALAMEPAEPGVMRQPPRPPQEPILSRPLWRIITRESAIIALATMASYLWGIGRYGAGAQARTMAFSTITFGEILYARACRTERPHPRGEAPKPNRYLAYCLAASAGAQVLALLLPPLRVVFGTAPLALADWLMVAGTSSSILALAEASKRLPAAPEPRALPARREPALLPA